MLWITDSNCTVNVDTIDGWKLETVEPPRGSVRSALLSKGQIVGADFGIYTLVDYS